MSKNFSANYRAACQRELTTIALCWRIEKTDGTVILGTEHDRDIPVTVTEIGMAYPTDFTLDGVYQAGAGIRGSSIESKADLAVDNMEVEGALQDAPRAVEDTLYIDVAIADIQSGVLDSARVAVFRLDWQDPDDFQDLLRYGFLGDISWTSEGQYRTEVRGLIQALQQNIGSTAGENCDVEDFGDHRCKLDLTPLTATGVVTAVTSRRRFDATLTWPGATPALGSAKLGKLTWDSANDNAGRIGQVKNDAVGAVLGNFELYEEAPFDVQVGDAFIVTEGCNRTSIRCKALGNILNFRGVGIFTPGMDEIIRAPD